MNQPRPRLDRSDPGPLSPPPRDGARPRVSPSFLGLPRASPSVLGLLLLALAACGGPAEQPAGGEETEEARDERPATRTDTVRIEGMPEPITLDLYQAPDDFPLRFSTYVPEDMDAETDASERTAHFTAEFGGVRNEDAFVHLYVFPPDTPAQEAIALAKGYKTGRGIPVSRGIEIIADELRPPALQEALEAFRFRYQAEGGWFAGMVGVARHQDRHYMLLQHYPVEYGDGFGPRADLIFESWEWADGSPLHDSAGPAPRSDLPAGSPAGQEREAGER